MNDITPYMLLYSANFAFIVTNIYGWIIKAFYRSEPYRGDFAALFPSQRAVAALYLMQIFEIPYLLMLPDPKALFYVNAFSILLFSSLILVMCNGYFFLKREKVWPMICHFLPVALVVLYLLAVVVGVISMTDITQRVMFWVITAIFLYYVARRAMIKRKINQVIRAVDEQVYSNSDDFPVRFARHVEWLPIGTCLLMYLCFVLNDPYVKMWRDVLFVFVNVWFLIYTMNPHRSLAKFKQSLEHESMVVSDVNAPKYKLSEQRSKELESSLIELIEKDKLFLESSLTLDQLSGKLNVNRNYVSEVISRSSYGSFYNLINTYRVECAQQILRRDPTLKIEHVAFDSGFSSASLFSQIFKRYMKITPSAFVKELLADKYTQNK